MTYSAADADDNELLERLKEAIHAPFVYSNLDGHKHDYQPNQKRLANGIIERTCSICGFKEPVLTFTRLIN